MGMVSNCCTASPWLETDICSACKEHAEFYDEDVLQTDDLAVGRKYRVIDPIVLSPNPNALMPVGTILFYEGEIDGGYQFREEGNAIPLVFPSSVTEIPELEEVR